MLGRMKIASRLFIGFGTLVLIVAVVSGYGGRSALTTRTLLDNVVRLKTNEVRDRQFEKLLQDARLGIWMALATDDQSRIPAVTDAFTLATAHLDDLLAHTVVPARITAVHALKLQLADFQAKAVPLLALRGGNRAC
jgi:hypothetical protein